MDRIFPFKNSIKFIALFDNFMKMNLPSLTFWPPQKWLSHVIHNSKSNLSLYEKSYRYIIDATDINPGIILNKIRLIQNCKHQTIPKIGHIHIPKTGGTYSNTIRDSMPHVNFTHIVLRRNRSDKYCPIGLQPTNPRNVKDYFIPSPKDKMK